MKKKTVENLCNTICLTQALEVTTDEFDSYLWSTRHNSKTAQLFGNVPGLSNHMISVPVNQKPNLGCNIKWKSGNEPNYL